MDSNALGLQVQNQLGSVAAQANFSLSIIIKDR